MNVSEAFGEPVSTVLMNALMGCLKSDNHVKFADCRSHFNEQAMRSEKQCLDNLHLPSQMRPTRLDTCIIALRTYLSTSLMIPWSRHTPTRDLPVIDDHRNGPRSNFEYDFGIGLRWRVAYMSLCACLRQGTRTDSPTLHGMCDQQNESGWLSLFVG